MIKIWNLKILLFVLLIFNNISGQNKLFRYNLKYKPNPSKDSIITESTVLDIEKQDKSVFRTEQEKQSDSLYATTGLGLGKKIRFEDQFYVVKNLAENQIYKSIKTIYNDIYFINIKEKLDWQILPEKEKIEGIEVQKAKINYSGRIWTAWFANDIPIQDGPYIFHGLPGLIIKISDEKNDYSFNLTEIKNAKYKIYTRNKGLELNWSQFQKICENYYSDPLARIKSMGAPFKVDDGNGNAVTPDMKVYTDKIKKRIKENNNPIELNYKVDYE